MAVYNINGRTIEGLMITEVFLCMEGYSLMLENGKAVFTKSFWNNESIIHCMDGDSIYIGDVDKYIYIGR